MSLCFSGFSDDGNIQKKALVGLVDKISTLSSIAFTSDRGDTVQGMLLKSALGGTKLGLRAARGRYHKKHTRHS